MNSHCNLGRVGRAVALSAIVTLCSVGTAFATDAAKVKPFVIERSNTPNLTFPPSTSYCLANFGIHCYQPYQLAKAYNLTPLHSTGIDGSGQPKHHRIHRTLPLAWTRASTTTGRTCQTQTP